MSVYGNIYSSVCTQTEKNNRIQDTITNDSTKYEVKREKNGKLRCLVCPSYPSLDTFPAFLGHRNGRKHQHSLISFREKLDRVREENKNRQKRRTLHSKRKELLPSYQREQNTVVDNQVTPEVEEAWKEYRVTIFSFIIFILISNFLFKERQQQYREYYSSLAHQGWKW